MDLPDVFVYCTPKCGGSTLANTFCNNGFNACHIHCKKKLGFFDCVKKNNMKPLMEQNDNAIFNIITESALTKPVYIIDSYRTPIERKISAFFQNIHTILPNYKNLSIDSIISHFNKENINRPESLSIYEPMRHFKIPPFKHFNFKRRYNIKRVGNLIFLVVLFKDIKNWDKILSDIVGKEIKIHPYNETKDKEIYNLYNEFKKKYRLPKEYIEKFLLQDSNFRIYNTQQQQQNYINKWKSLII
jgi:hypothetical protein